MEDYYSEWRRRLAVHAALLLLFSILVGYVYHDVLQTDDAPHCTAANIPHEPNDPLTPYDPDRIRVCNPEKLRSELSCEFDSPCLPDTVLEHRWRSAHQQGLLHALLLLGVAVAAPYFRVGRFIFGFAGWLIIAGVWSAPIAAVIQALGTTHTTQPTMACLVTPGEEVFITHCMSNTIGAVAGISTSIALAILGLRSAWEAIRDGVAPSTWRNWARIVKARPRRIETPRIPKDGSDPPTKNLEDVVAKAVKDKTTVRAFGGRYSWSAIAPTDGVMVDMRRFNEVGAPTPFTSLDPHADAEATHTVRVMAGARIRKLTRKLMESNLMLQTSPVNPWIQVGGALANGCHGTGVGHKPLTDLVTSIEIIQVVEDLNGELQVVNNTYTRPLIPFNHINPSWIEWQALMVNLGCLGIMHAVTFECVPIYGVRIVDRAMNMHATIDNDNRLRDLIGYPPLTPDADHKRYAEFFWFPFNEEIFVRSWEPEISTSAHADFSRWFWIKQILVAKLLGPLIFAIMGLMPFLTPMLMKLFHMMFGSTDARVSAPNAMQYERFFMRVYDMGHAIGYDPDPSNSKGFETFKKAWWQVVEKLENARHQGAYPQNLVLHVRFGRESRGLLHPTKGNGDTAYMEVVTHVNAAGTTEYFEAIEEVWHRLGGKSHWGKITPRPDRLIENYYSTDVANFREVRDRMDPGEIFLNDYVRRVLE